MEDPTLTLATLPAHELAPMIRRKQVSPVEVMQAVLDRVERLEPRLNAMAFLDAEGAMAGARAAEKAVMGSAPLGRLHGLPVTVKDEVLFRMTAPFDRLAALPPLKPALKFAAVTTAALLATRSEETPPMPLPRPRESHVLTAKVPLLTVIFAF